MKDVSAMENYGEILIYQSDDGLNNVEVKIQDETVWLTQQQMAELFQTSRTNVVEHIKHIYDEGELDEISTCRKFRQVRKEGKREVAREIPFYNLDTCLCFNHIDFIRGFNNEIRFITVYTAGIIIYVKLLY